MNPHADNVIMMITTTTKITEQEIAMASTSPLLRELVAEIHKYKINMNTNKMLIYLNTHGKVN